MTKNPGLGFIGAPSNRGAQFRDDKSWLQAHLESTRSQFVIFAGDRPLISVANNTLSVVYWNFQKVKDRTEMSDAILLHLDEQEHAVFIIDIGEKAGENIVSDEIKLIDLRSLARQAALLPADLGMLAQARSMLFWHAHHKFCPNCGSNTVVNDAGYRRSCTKCDTQHFPRVDPVVIMQVRHDNKFLMGRGKNFPGANYSALAGFVEPGETIEDATRRETFEETGVKIGKVTYLMSQPWPFPSSLMIGVLADAETTEITIDENELEDARWFSVNEIRQMNNNNHPQEFSMPAKMSIAWQMMQQILDTD